MSDTSIVQSGSSQHNYGYEMDENSNRRKGNCWTRIGANICVGILTLTTIFLLVALLFVLYRQQEMEKLRRIKAQKNGKKIDWVAPAEGIFSMISGIFGGSSDSNEIFSNLDDIDE